MIALSQRLQTIADNIELDESVADIGTDHGYLPLYLYERYIANKKKNHNEDSHSNVIRPLFLMTDVSAGSLKKAEDNCKRYYPSEYDNNEFDLRLGDGLDVISPEEVDVIIMAGIGGLLMKEIMDWDISKTMSYKKLILQPRNNGGALRRYLYEQGIPVDKLLIVPEDRRYCEIMVCHIPSVLVQKSKDKSNKDVVRTESDLDDVVFEFPDILIENLRDKNQNSIFTNAYLENAKMMEQRIIDNILAGRTPEDKDDPDIALRQKRIDRINYLLSK